MIADSLSRQTPGLGVRVESSPRRGQLSPGSVAGHSQPVRHHSDVPLARLLFSSRSPADVGQAPGVCFPSLHPDPAGNQQVTSLPADLHHLDHSFLATESGFRNSRAWLWLLQCPCHFGEIFSDNRISIACTRTSPCFDFMSGNYSMLHPQFRSFLQGRQALSLSVLSVVVPTPLGVLSVLVS